MSEPGIYGQGLDRDTANHVPLSPLSFLQRAADVFGDRVSVIHGERRFTWSQTLERSRRLASALSRLGVQHGDTVAVMLPNVPAMVEAHFGVPMTGAVLNALNVRLDARTVAFMLAHSRTRVLLADTEYAGTIAQALDLLEGPRPVVIDVADAAVQDGVRLGETEYEAFLAAADGGFEWQGPADEWDAIALGYTSGTTGDPKGVVTHHRGAYLNAVNNILAWSLPPHSVYLWTLPMFHCNGWCFPWTMAAVAGTNVCLRRVETATIFALMREHRVTHYCGAPIVHAMLAGAPASERAGIEHPIRGMVAGAPPPAETFQRMERIGIDLTHVYGLTETYGPAVVCAPQPDWDALPAGERVALQARQGVRYPLQEGVAVLDPQTLEPVPADGETVGEVMFRGNIVMKGYLLNPEATTRAFAGGWFHSGDLAVVHPDGYLRIKDRSKDVIISGGENISSIEVEDAIQSHPAVLGAAVVSMPDARWGEVPAAFVELRDGETASEGEIADHCGRQLASFKRPKRIVFGPLPRTSTGKVQKFALRAQLAEAAGEG